MNSLFKNFVSSIILLTAFSAGQVYAYPGGYEGDCTVCHIAPTITAFDLPASHTSLTVPVSAFSATDTDNVKASRAIVTGFMLTTTTAAPATSAAGWQASPPADFTFAAAGPQTLYAWAKDAIGNVSASRSDMVNILINGAPTADAGPDQTVAEGMTVGLNASNSMDPDDGIAALYWEQIGGPSVVLTDRTAEDPTFVTPDVGPSGVAMTFRLTVTDNSGAKDSDTCIVNVTWVNLAPTANAGPDQTVPQGGTVRLDANASLDADDGIAAYLWEQTGGPAVQLSDATAVQPEFTPVATSDQGDSLTFQLTVTDNGGLADTDTCVVNITSSNNPPIADAGSDQTVVAGNPVELDGSASADPDNDAVTYLWKQTSGAPVSLSDTGAVRPVFTAPTPTGQSEMLVFELTVSDAAGLQATDICVVSIQTGDVPLPVDTTPVADAGEDQQVAAGTAVTLDGSGSTDAEGPIAAYLWVQIEGPEVTVSDPTSVAPTFAAPNAVSQNTALMFELTVVDAAGQEATDNSMVTIQAVESQPIGDVVCDDDEADDDDCDDEEDRDGHDDRDDADDDDEDRDHARNKHGKKNKSPHQILRSQDDDRDWKGVSNLQYFKIQHER